MHLAARRKGLGPFLVAIFSQFGFTGNSGAFAKSQKPPFSVIPAQAGIQYFRAFLDSRLRGSDGSEDFLP